MTAEQLLDRLIEVLKKDGVPDANWVIDKESGKVIITVWRVNGTSIVCDLLLKSVKTAAKHETEKMAGERLYRHRGLSLTLRKIRRMLREGGHYSKDIYVEKEAEPGRMDIEDWFDALVERVKASGEVMDASWSFYTRTRHARNRLYPVVDLVIAVLDGRKFQHSIASAMVAITKSQEEKMEYDYQRIMQSVRAMNRAKAKASVDTAG